MDEKPSCGNHEEHVESCPACDAAELLKENEDAYQAMGQVP